MQKNYTDIGLALLLSASTITSVVGQNPTPTAKSPTRAALAPAPSPQSTPMPGAASDQPYAPRAILPGGIVVTLFPPDSKYLNAERIREPEKYSLSKDVPGRINSIVNIHNPSIEVHLVDRSLNTGSVVILVAGGGHNTLNVGSEAADFVAFFYNYGVNTVILRNRLRKDGYNAKTDAVYDAQQAIRMVRAHAKDWRLDPKRIGIMGFSAGAELAAPAAIAFDEFDKAKNEPSDPLAGITSRPDFVGIVYPGPTPFARGASPPIPRTTPPSFIVCAGSGDRGHAVWADEYFAAMLKVSVPNIEMHIYGNGHHPGSGSTGGLTDRKNTPFGTWQNRFIDWFRDLGFLQSPGVETRAAMESAAYAQKPPRGKQAKALTPTAARTKVGEKITVEMKVQAAKDRLEKRGEIYLDAETDFHDAKNFAVVITKTGAAKLKEAGINDPADHFLNKTIRATGIVTVVQDIPRIEIDDAKQLRIVAPTK